VFAHGGVTTDECNRSSGQEENSALELAGPDLPQLPVR
jgi:hypothetical protein